MFEWIAVLDVSSDDKGELAVAMMNYHTKSYQNVSKSICKFIENHSDVTFIGDPMPCDLSEVCHELLEDSTINLQM